MNSPCNHGTRDANEIMNAGAAFRLSGETSQAVWSDTDPSGLEIYTIGGVLNYAGPIIWNDDATYFYYFAAVSIPDQDQMWGCASCGPSYESAWMTHYYANNVHYHYDLGGGGTEDLAVTARTWMKLYTGGKAGVNRQNLFCINAGATEYGRPPMDYEPPFYPWWSTPSWDVADKTSIRVLGKYLGADGNLWVTLPDNASLDLFIAAPPRHYDAWAGVQKYNLKIQVNSAAFLSPNGVVAGANYCVGQKLTFSPYWLPSDPPFTDAMDHWTLPDKFVNEQPFSWCDAYYDEDASLLNHLLSTDGTLSTSCWYVDKVSAGTASVAMSLSFPNGQTAFVGASGLFNVYKPSISFTTNDNSSSPTVDIDDSPDTGPTSMMVGHPGGVGSMEFHAHITSTVPGEALATQLINSWWEAVLHNSLGVGPFGTGGGYWLDKNEEMGDSVISTNGIANPTVYDQPATQLLVPPYYPYYSLSRNDSFKDYFRFRPSGDGNIYVTLGMATWNWYGNAYEDSYLTHWTLTSGSVAGPSVTESQEFPFWEYTY